MTVYQLGIHTPTNRDDYEAQPWLNEYADLSGMEYAVYPHRDPDVPTVLIETNHDAVGLVTYWIAATDEEAESWVYKQSARSDKEAAETSLGELTLAAGSLKEELVDAVLAGLAAIGDIENWDSETIEVLINPVVRVLEDAGIPSVGSSYDDARAFWRGVAIATGNGRN